MFELFEESGIFITACRHRTVLYVCDMIKSRELYNSFPVPDHNTNLDLFQSQIPFSSRKSADE